MMETVCYRCVWDEETDIGYYQESEVFAFEGEGDPPDEVAALVLRVDAEAEIERLRAENEALKQRKSCRTCARERGAAKCNNCALYYVRRPCQWIPAKTALRGEVE